MYNDKQLVRITMFVLLVGIVLVYAVFFNIHGESLSASAQNVMHKWSSGEERQQEDTVNTTGSGDTLAEVTGLQQS